MRGTPHVEDWVDPTEQPPGFGPDDVDAWHRLAEGRLQAARQRWSANRAAPIGRFDPADIVAHRSQLPDDVPGQTVAAAEIAEQRRWLLDGPRCRWRDVAGFLERATR
jgi:predicted short-subunit dehydrogenase-like oxidoreductase (DUF2520 family)